MHREVRVGNSMIMIGEGAGEVVPVRPIAFHVYVEDAGATFDRAIAAGVTSLGAPEERPYGDWSGFVRDAFGNDGAWPRPGHLGISGRMIREGWRAPWWTRSVARRAWSIDVNRSQVFRCVSSPWRMLPVTITCSRSPAGTDVLV